MTKRAAFIALFLTALLEPAPASQETKSNADASQATLFHAVTSIAFESDIDWLSETERLQAEGLPAGPIYEALLARFCIAQDVDNLVATYVAIEERQVELPIGEDRLFATAELRDGFLAGLAALQASRWQDVTLLRTKAKEAYSKNPDAFAMLDIRDLLEEVQERSQQGLADIFIPLETELIGATDDRQITIKNLLNGKNGLYLDFWASWCGPCIRAMPELKDRAHRYERQGLAMAGVNTDNTDPKKKSLATQRRFDMEIPWLIEPPVEPLSGPLRINSIPRVILLNPDGKVLFNGHPEDLELKFALMDLGIVP